MDTEAIQNERAAEIAKLNDAARSNAVNYMATGGVIALDESVVSEIFVGVQNFTDFNEDNDPYGEHDFGSFEIQGHKVFWKIDYYDQQLKYGTEPLDPDCRRVVTVMLAEEY